MGLSSVKPTTAYSTILTAASLARAQPHALGVVRAPASLPPGRPVRLLLAFPTIPGVEDESQRPEDPASLIDPSESCVLRCPTSAPLRLLAVARDGRWVTCSATRRDACRGLRTTRDSTTKTVATLYRPPALQCLAARFTAASIKKTGDRPRLLHTGNGGPLFNAPLPQPLTRLPRTCGPFYATRPRTNLGSDHAKFMQLQEFPSRE